MSLDSDRLHRGSAPSRFVRAFVLPWRGLGLLRRQRRWWPWALAPAAVHLVLFVAAAWGVAAGADAVVAAWWAQPEGGLLQAAWYAAVAVAVAVGLGLAYVLTLLVGGVLASPFVDALSERAEALLAGAAAEGGSGVVRSIVASAAVLGLYVLLLLPVLLLNAVPVLGSLAATALGALLGAFFLALEFAGGVLERRGLGLRARLRLLRRHLALTLGFGLGAALMLWVPFVNLLVLPAVAVGGTALGLALLARDEAVR